MATTHARIYKAIEHTSTSQTWSDYKTLAESIRNRIYEEYKVKGGNNILGNQMKIPTIVKLLELMKELDILTLGRNGQVKLSSYGVNCRKSEDDYNLYLVSALKTHFRNKNVPISLIAKTINNIKLPDIPNSDTIFSHLNNDELTINLSMFKKLLYLYSCAEGIKRNVRVHYSV